MLDVIRRLLDRRVERKRVRSAQDAALRKVAEHFMRETGIQPMGCVVISNSAGDIVIRVMHLTNRIPPERTWYAVRADGSIAKLPKREGEQIDNVPWR